MLCTLYAGSQILVVILPNVILSEVHAINLWEITTQKSRLCNLRSNELILYSTQISRQCPRGNVVAGAYVVSQASLVRSLVADICRDFPPNGMINFRTLGCWAVHCERFLIYPNSRWKTFVKPSQAPLGLVGAKARIPRANYKKKKISGYYLSKFIRLI